MTLMSRAVQLSSWQVVIDGKACKICSTSIIRTLVRFEERLRAEGKQVNIVPMTLKKGQVSFH